MKPSDPWLDLPEGLPPRLREYVEPFQTEKGRSRLNWAVGVLAVLSLFAMLAAGASTPTDPSLGALTTTTTLPPPKASRIPGFNEVSFTVGFIGAPGRDRRFCGVHAAATDQQVKGLTARTDLAGYDAMVFTFGGDVQQKFTMRNVRIPLTVAFFNSTGLFVGSTDMKPCPRLQRRCPEYGAPADQKFRTAIEVPEGGLNRLGVGQGSLFSAGGGCI
ncbi:MAG TPA: DUF192 domain-containing protein [Acidimicrobiales bacterium]|nr:DUF192 domain-containing protein [Acidimicrobiales bacterium]